MAAKTYTLLGPDRRPYQSAIARGQYVRNRVFFADEQTAVAAGYRPCAVCMPDEYAQWKATSLSKVRRAGFGDCGPR